ncbi:conserved hypothetical protein [Ricinus communis]|uniref:Uncharacterized protein n=1 Tax=Ricinus communis TaxID=3988 RepID=B9RC76_RICCO|nr:conserved hypothetical protein [Ricinus communis]
MAETTINSTKRVVVVTGGNREKCKQLAANGKMVVLTAEMRREAKMLWRN